MGESSPGVRVPGTLKAAAAIAALEGLGATAAGIWLAIAALVERPTGLAIALGSAMFVLAAGVGLAVLARGLFRAERWSRGLTVVIQLITLPLGFEFLGAPTTVVGVSMLTAAVATLVLVLAPSSTAVFRD